MVGGITHQREISSDGITAIGIDVGGQRKGFHAVALTAGRYSSHCASTQVSTVVEWCHSVNGTVIAVDAPCRWSRDGRARPAERQLMAQGIWCFSTPTRRRALEHQKNYYGWMLQGEVLFQALESSHALCSELPLSGQKCCFETFPHAITRQLTNGKPEDTTKRVQRRKLLGLLGIDLAHLTNLDLVDAALCALTAYYVATGRECVCYGESDSGFIIVPQSLNS